MSRNKVLTIIIIAIVALLAAFGFWYYFSLSNGGFGGVNNQNGGLGGVSFPASTGGVSSSSPATLNGTSTSAATAEAPVPRLRQIANVPVAGAGFQDRTFQILTIATSTVKGKVVSRTTKINLTKTFISFMQRADGHLYETATDTIFTGRISNTTIPKIYTADFVAGNSILLRYLDDDNETIETFLSTLVKKPATVFATSTATTTAATQQQATTSPDIIAADVDAYGIQGSFLPQEIRTYSLSPDKSQMLYLQANSDGSNGSHGSIGIIRTFGNAKTNLVFSSPFKQWIPDWASSKSIFMTTAPSEQSSGFLYLLNQSNGGLTKLLGPLTGFQTLGNSDGSKVLYSTSDAHSVSLSVYSLKDKSSTAVNLKTLPDKCVWSKQNSNLLYCAVPNVLPQDIYPDAWYQGLVSFSDSLWSINTLTGQTLLLVNPSSTSGVSASIDATHLQLDSSEDTLMFMNKSDLTLWDYRLVEPAVAIAPTQATSTATSSQR